jgi:hypothetical protein
MIELFTAPALGAVAGIAFFAQIALVGIVVLVAIDTLRWRLAIQFFRLVATVAFRLAMLSRQWVVSDVMIETVGIETYDDRGATFVFGMAGMTFRACHLFALAVITFLCLNVLVDFFMTVEA